MLQPHTYDRVAGNYALTGWDGQPAVPISGPLKSHADSPSWSALGFPLEWGPNPASTTPPTDVTGRCNAATSHAEHSRVTPTRRQRPDKRASMHALRDHGDTVGQASGSRHEQPDKGKALQCRLTGDGYSL